jgi:4-hydroxy-tetrahydrodipicolinate synthase
VRGLTGIVVAPVTPMRRDLSIDLDGLRVLVDHLVGAGVHALTPCAMTAEVETLDLDEHREVLRVTVETVAGRVPVYSGVGRASILETRSLVAYAEDIGSDGLFLITPYCNSYTKDEALQYYEDIAVRASVPIMIYNCPGYSGINLTPEDHARLAGIDNIVATKEGNQGQLQDTVLATAERMAVFTARDSYLLPSLALGAEGVVSFAANVVPQLLLDLYAAAQDGNWARARELHGALCPLVNALVARSYPLMIKTAMSLLNLPAGPARRIGGGATPEEVTRLMSVLPAIAVG